MKPKNDSENEVEDLFEVKAIHAKRLKGGREEYLIEWVGYDERTWEPKKNLENIKKMIEKFDARNELVNLDDSVYSNTSSAKQKQKTPSFPRTSELLLGKREKVPFDRQMEIDCSSDSNKEIPLKKNKQGAKEKEEKAKQKAEKLVKFKFKKQPLKNYFSAVSISDQEEILEKSSQKHPSFKKLKENKPRDKIRFENDEDSEEQPLRLNEESLISLKKKDQKPKRVSPELILAGKSNIEMDQEKRSESEEGSFAKGDSIQRMKEWWLEYDSQSDGLNKSIVIKFKVEWRKREKSGEKPKSSLVSHSELRKHAPQRLLDFYESYIQFY